MTTPWHRHPDSPVIRDADGAAVCIVSAHRDSEKHGRMIVGAPQMLEALQNVANQRLSHEMTGTEYKHADFESAYETMCAIARAAIAKTTEGVTQPQLAAGIVCPRCNVVRDAEPPDGCRDPACPRSV